MVIYSQGNRLIRIDNDIIFDKPNLYCQNPQCKKQISSDELILIKNQVYHNEPKCYSEQFEQVCEIEAMSQEKLFQLINSKQKKIEFKGKKLKSRIALLM